MQPPYQPQQPQWQQPPYSQPSQPLYDQASQFRPSYTPLPQPMPPLPPPPAPKKSRPWLWITALVIVFFLGVGVGRSGGSNTNDTTTPTTVATATSTNSSSAQPTQAPTATPKPTAAPKWVTVQKFTGNGNKKTGSFTVSDNWAIEWACDPASFGGIQYNVIIDVYNSDGTQLDTGAINTLCKTGNTHDLTQEHQGGTVYLDIQSEGSWAVGIQNLQ